MATRITKCDTTYIQQTQVEHPPQWRIMASIEQKGEDNIRCQGASWRIAPDNRNPKCVEEIWKDWGETWMWENKKGL